MLKILIGEEFQFRNLTVLDLFLELYHDKNNLASSSSLQVLVAEQMLQIIQMNPINYFILSQKSTILCKLVEDVDNSTPHMQQLVLAILKHVVVVLNYVPYKELSLLFSHFDGSSKPETTLLVAKTLLMFLESSSDWRDTFRELGLVDALSSLVQFIDKEAAGISTPISWESGKFTLSKSITENFELIMNLLEELLKSDQNLLVFREKTNHSLFNLLQHKDFSKGAILVIRVRFYLNLISM
jgi:hypothetical protein